MGCQNTQEKSLNKIQRTIKVAHVVNLILVFMGQFFYNLVILIKLCKSRYLNPIPKSIISKKPEFLCKILMISNYHRILFFFNFTLVSYLPISGKECSGFFYFVSIKVINKNVKNKCAEIRSF